MKVRADYEVLKKVVIHRPDAGIEKVTPSNADYLLYDDIIYLPQMQDEHEVFLQVIEAFLGQGNVIELEDLLRDILEETAVRQKLIKAVQNLHQLSDHQIRTLINFEAKPLARILISGYEEKGNTVFPPLPNLIFTRDIGVMVEDHLLTCHARKYPRKRENILTWFILHHHPIFREIIDQQKWIDLSTDDKQLVEHLMDSAVTIEGGDVMMFGPRHLIIAESDRTNRAAIDQAQALLFEKGVLDRLTVVDIPKAGYCMHIDTIFSKIDEHDYVVFAKVLFDETQVSVTQFSADGRSQSYLTLKEFVLAEDPNARFAMCGNGEYPSDEREQWTSACNFVTLKPGVALCYDRNSKTIEVLRGLGYKILKANYLLEAIDHKIVTPTEIEKAIITIPAGELSRAGGGPHCLTFPLWRTE